MATCLQVADFERLEQGLLDEEGQRKIRAHLDACESCRAAYEEHRHDNHFLRNARTLLSGLHAEGNERTLDPFAPTGKSRAVYPKIEGYVIQSVLGQGGMGIVYRALQTKLSRTVALKVLPAVVGTASPSAVERFRREATAAARLHHTNIIPIYDFGESPDGYYYAMEMIVGQPLGSAIKSFAEHEVASATPARFAALLRNTVYDVNQQADLDAKSNTPVDSGSGSLATSSSGRGRIYYRHVARWIADAAEALHYAHSQGIIHRDIKPANLILSVDGRIMVADFGLAKSVEESSVTLTGSLLGTLRYLSPEQAMAKRVRVDHRTDVYSLGATMYELLCYEPAFSGSDDKEILSAIITREPTPPRKVVNSIPAELETICLKAMEKSPDARYDTARAMAEDLRRYSQDLPIVARRPGPIRRTLKFVRRRKATVMAALVVLILGLGVPYLAREMRSRRLHHRDSLFDSAMYTTQQAMKDPEDLGLWAKARENFETALEIDPNHFQSIHGLAWMKTNLVNSLPTGTPDRDARRAQLLHEADELCRRAIALRPDDDGILNLRGVVLKKLGRYDEAIGIHERIQEITRDMDSETEAGAHYIANFSNLGNLYALKGDLGRAEAYLSEGAELSLQRGVDPDDRAEAFLNLASLELQRNDPEAWSHIQQAIRASAANPHARTMKARICLEMEGLCDSVQTLVSTEFAVQTADDPEKGGRADRARRMLARMHLKRGEWTKAREAAAVGSDDPITSVINRLIMAVCDANLGRSSDAQQHYLAALDAWPKELEANSPIATADQGVLWFENIELLNDLRRQAEEAIEANTE